MTIEATTSATKGLAHHPLDDDILAALWEHAPFPRLPLDAPLEIRELLVDVENPKKVYSIYRASRRHDLQLLIEKFIFQLRHGCGCHDCITPSCFACRRRLAGKAPIRRYNATSARTLAIYLASQDNPESRLCPHLQTPDRASDAIKPLIFGPTYGASASSAKARVASKVKPVLEKSERTRPRRHSQQAGHITYDRNHERNSGDKVRRPKSPAANHYDQHVHISEKAVSKDYRSFAANVFGTVAYKMLEWLTPNSIEAMSDKVEAEANSSGVKDENVNLSSSDDDSEQLFVPSLSGSQSHIASQENGANVIGNPDDLKPDQIANGRLFDCEQAKTIEKPAVSEIPKHPQRSSTSRKSSNARIRTSSGSKPQNKLVIDPSSDIAVDTGLRSPPVLLSQSDKVSKGPVRLSSASRSISQLGNGNLYDTIPSKQVSEPPASRLSHVDGHYSQADGVNGEEASSSNDTTQQIDTPSENREHGIPLEPSSDIDSYLPQSLSRLNIQAVNFICDVLQEDATAEKHLLSPSSIATMLTRSPSRRKPWKRRRRSQVSYPSHLKLQWRLFAEQGIFSVLSDPDALLESFTNRDGSIDSQTLWYCMLRLTRVAPSLVFDSLWAALATLFAAPRSLQSPRSPTAKVFSSAQKSFSNAKAASLISICLHALVAAAPLITNPRQLLDMSRIRSHGLSLTGSGAIAKQPIELCLQYEDAFTDDMALRLARRLFTIIPTRRYFDELIELDLDSDDGITEPDVVEMLLSHIEPSTFSALGFSKSERSLHEKRVPILLLDWARAVMLHEWDGKPVVSGDGPFGGALSLMAAMYQKRQSLLLGDVHFRSEYFGDRLDLIEMPVSWVSFTSTRQKVHLLDYPYIFNPTSLVSYFRAINFSRMSRAYEESSSLQSRISSIVAPESLVTEAHQKNFLQDLLKVPASKYLILDIGRHNVLMDAFDQIWRREERELMRPLKVHLGEDSGEEGFDSGGVQQEFFRLAVAEALNPDYGAFTIDDRTRMTWFQAGSLQPEWKYELIGLLMSLAVYNGLTLPITFPKALYRKMLGEPVTELHHISDGWPEIANGLTTLLEWNEKDGAVEDIFCLTYEFTASMFDKPISRVMQPDSPSSSNQPSLSWPQFSTRWDAIPLPADNPTDAAPVTGDNRNAYVSDYIRYLTDISVSPQYAAFVRGFKACLQPKSLSLLTPSLLQSIVEGTQEIDVAELKRAARYVGWDASHRTVRDFWSVVRRYDEPMKRKLLEFVTASDRVPVGGVAGIQFVVQKNGEEEGEGGHLPTAYTCYGTLLLPEYRDKEVLRERLAMALENAQGFGFA
ncbi:hypothetical protein F5Y15DRAFT_414322 [Xylariaceae sp. FL0016]|nr:hypothetical protein F5Y15DRAFT_414322 [Xylariaceae sp. FL0016]